MQQIFHLSLIEVENNIAIFDILFSVFMLYTLSSFDLVKENSTRNDYFTFYLSTSLEQWSNTQH